MPRGGKRAGAGRPRGSLAKLSNEVRALAQVYGPDAIDRLAVMSRLKLGEGELKNFPWSETTQFNAIKELLDRGYGRPHQTVSGPDGGAVEMIITGVRRFTDEAS